ncbi:hypothetical protein D3C76_877420 [compost metagenome]
MAEVGADTQAEHRGDVDDVAGAAGLGQALGAHLGDAPDAVEVGRQHGAPVFLADIQCGLALADTSVIDHDVHYAEFGFRGVEGGLDAFAVGDVHGHCQYITAHGADFPGKLLQAVNTACADDHPCAVLGDSPGVVRANAAGCAGDQDGLAGQGEDIVFHQNTSNRPAAPMPPPTHMVTTTYFTPRRLPSSRACPTIRAPLMP